MFILFFFFSSRIYVYATKEKKNKQITISNSLMLYSHYFSIIICIYQGHLCFLDNCWKYLVYLANHAAGILPPYTLHKLLVMRIQIKGLFLFMNAFITDHEADRNKMTPGMAVLQDFSCWICMLKAFTMHFWKFHTFYAFHPLCCTYRTRKELYNLLLCW